MPTNCTAEHVAVTVTTNTYGDSTESLGYPEGIEGDLVLFAPGTNPFTPGATEPTRTDGTLYLRPPRDFALTDRVIIDGTTYVLAEPARRWDTGAGLAGTEVLLRRWVKP